MNLSFQSFFPSLRSDGTEYFVKARRSRQHFRWRAAAVSQRRMQAGLCASFHPDIRSTGALDSFQDTQGNGAPVELINLFLNSFRPRAIAREQGQENQKEKRNIEGCQGEKSAERRRRLAPVSGLGILPCAYQIGMPVSRKDEHCLGGFRRRRSLF